MRELETFQHDLGRAVAEFRAACAYADTQTESHWRRALAGTLKDEVLLTQAATWITSACIRSWMSALGSAAPARYMRPRRCSDGCAIFTSWPSTPPSTHQLMEVRTSCCSAIHRPGASSAWLDGRHGHAARHSDHDVYSLHDKASLRANGSQ
jgi:hypothetical protein